MTQARLELLADSSGIRTATNDLKNLERQSGVTESKTKKSFSGVGRNAGQAGIQIQQFVGQVQGGQSAMLALSQQAADLGIVLGAPLVGVIVSLGAVVAGALLPNLFKGAEATKELIADLEKLKKTSSLTAEQAAFLAIQEQKSVIEKKKLVAEIQEEIKANEALNKSRSERNLTGRGSNVSAQKALQKAIKDTGEEIIEQKARLSLLNQEIKVSEGAVEAYGKAVDGVFKSDDQVSAINSIISSLKVQEVALKKGELAGNLYAAVQATGAASVKDLDSEITRLITSIYNAKQARKADQQAIKDQESAQRELVAGLKEEKRERKRLADELVRQQNAANAEIFASLQEEQQVRQAFFNLQNQLAAENNPAEQARQQLQARLDVIREFYGLESNEQALQYAAGVDAEKSYQDQLAKIRKAGADQYQQQQISTLGYTSQFFGTLAQIAEAGGKDSFDSYKLLASAQAGIAAAMAVLQVYADPSITNTYLKIGLAGAIAGLAGAQIKQIQSAEYSGSGASIVGSFEGGGYIPNKPRTGGLDGRGGMLAMVHPNESIIDHNLPSNSVGGASPNFNVNIVNNGSAMVETSQPRFSQEDRAWVLDVFVSDMDRRGRSFGAIKRNTTASGRTI